jgi:hypothetical protein
LRMLRFSDPNKDGECEDVLGSGWNVYARMYESNEGSKAYREHHSR